MSHSFPSPRPDFVKRGEEGDGSMGGGLYERDQCRDDRQITAALLKEQCREKTSFTLPHIFTNPYDSSFCETHKAEQSIDLFCTIKAVNVKLYKRSITVARMICAIFSY